MQKKNKNGRHDINNTNEDRIEENLPEGGKHTEIRSICLIHDVEERSIKTVLSFHFQTIFARKRLFEKNLNQKKNIEQKENILLPKQCRFF